MLLGVKDADSTSLSRRFVIQKYGELFWVTDGKAMFLVERQGLVKLRDISAETKALLKVLPDDGETLQYWKGGMVEPCQLVLYDVNRLDDKVDMCRLFPVPVSLPCSVDNSNTVLVDNVIRGLSYRPLHS
ncbi:MAG: hypothetical protein KDB07_06320, partial [Planctomycetes bacterium]|nr:hypothetical protein [Planctomycetota bacterium]